MKMSLNEICSDKKVFQCTISKLFSYYIFFLVVIYKFEEEDGEIIWQICSKFCLGSVWLAWKIHRIKCITYFGRNVIYKYFFLHQIQKAAWSKLPYILSSLGTVCYFVLLNSTLLYLFWFLIFMFIYFRLELLWWVNMSGPKKRMNTTASARLRQDYIRIKKDPVPYVIGAEPLPSNILEW